MLKVRAMFSSLKPKQMRLENDDRWILCQGIAALSLPERETLIQRNACLGLLRFEDCDGQLATSADFLWSRILWKCCAHRNSHSK